MKSYLIGFLAAFPIAIVAIFACIAALDQEADNRMHRQIEQNKKLVLKMPAIQRKHNVPECILEAGELACETSVKGVRKMVYYK